MKCGHTIQQLKVDVVYVLCSAYYLFFARCTSMLKLVTRQHQLLLLGGAIKKEFSIKAMAFFLLQCTNLVMY